MCHFDVWNTYQIFQWLKGRWKIFQNVLTIFRQLPVINFPAFRFITVPKHKKHRCLSRTKFRRWLGVFDLNLEHFQIGCSLDLQNGHWLDGPEGGTDFLDSTVTALVDTLFEMVLSTSEGFEPNNCSCTYALDCIQSLNKIKFGGQCDFWTWLSHCSCKFGGNFPTAICTLLALCKSLEYPRFSRTPTNEEINADKSIMLEELCILARGNLLSRSICAPTMSWGWPKRLSSVANALAKQSPEKPNPSIAARALAFVNLFKYRIRWSLDTSGRQQVELNIPFHSGHFRGSPSKSSTLMRGRDCCNTKLSESWFSWFWGMPLLTGWYGLTYGWSYGAV